MLYLSTFRTFLIYMHPSACKRGGQLHPEWGKNLPCTKGKTRSISRTVGKYTSHQSAAAAFCECQSVPQHWVAAVSASRCSLLLRACLLLTRRAPAFLLPLTPWRYCPLLIHAFLPSVINSIQWTVGIASVLFLLIAFFVITNTANENMENVWQSTSGLFCSSFPLPYTLSFLTDQSRLWHLTRLK